MSYLVAMNCYSYLVMKLVMFSDAFRCFASRRSDDKLSFEASESGDKTANAAATTSQQDSFNGFNTYFLGAKRSPNLGV